MLNFKRLTLDDIDNIKQYFLMSDTRSCDNTIGGSFMWRDYFCSEYAVYNETLVFKVKYLRGETAFSMPLGKDIDGAFNEIFDYCQKNQMPVIICMATASDISFLEKKYKLTAHSEDGWADYVYSADDLSQMPGRKFSGQRNHINHFKRENGIYRFEPICLSNINDVCSFLFEFTENHRAEKETSTFGEEEEKVLEVLRNFEKYQLFGTALYVSNKVVGFSVGEVVGDTLFVHIEKADAKINGAYPMLVCEFVKQNIDKKIVYVNREDDAGDEGLRRSKLSYHPIFMIEKYTVELIKP